MWGCKESQGSAVPVENHLLTTESRLLSAESMFPRDVSACLGLAKLPARAGNIMESSAQIFVEPLSRILLCTVLGAGRCEDSLKPLYLHQDFCGAQLFDPANMGHCLPRALQRARGCSAQSSALLSAKHICKKPWKV